QPGESVITLLPFDGPCRGDAQAYRGDPPARVLQSPKGVFHNLALGWLVCHKSHHRTSPCRKGLLSAVRLLLVPHAPSHGKRCALVWHAARHSSSYRNNSHLDFYDAN